MDLSTLKTANSDIGSVLEILHPVTEEKIEGMTVTLLGHDSAVYRKIQLAKQQAALNRIVKGKKGEDLIAEKLADDLIDDLAKLTISWTGFEMNGKELKCTQENAKMIYGDAGLTWLRDQVSEFVSNRANFFVK